MHDIGDGGNFIYPSQSYLRVIPGGLNETFSRENSLAILQRREQERLRKKNWVETREKDVPKLNRGMGLIPGNAIAHLKWRFPVIPAFNLSPHQIRPSYLRKYSRGM